MKIAEIFYSIQGEGMLVGTPSVFVRTSGCNLRCVWCDTPYTSWEPEGEEVALEEILARVARYRAHYVVVTGGEPMIAPEIVPLTRSAAPDGAARHHRDRGHGVRAGGLPPDEHQPEALQLHAARAGRRAGGPRSTTGCASGRTCCGG